MNGSAQRGAIYIVVLAVLAVLIPLGGLAVDGGAYFQARAQLGRALEASVQAASADGACDSAVAERYLTAYLGSSERRKLGAVSLTCGSDNTLKANLSVSGTFMRGVNIQQQVTLTPTGGASGPLEISIVVDISGSMSGAIPDLRTGVARFIERLPVDNAGQLQNAKVAIIPFSGEVLNRQLNGTVDCYSPGFAPPASLNHAGWEALMGALRADWPDRLSGFCSADQQSHSLYLTADSNVLKTYASQLQATGTTEIELGVIWGWRALDPRWTSYKASTALSERYGNAKKIMILFTDASGISGDHLTANGSDSLCGSIKQRDIEVFTIRLGS
ncbi:MAG: hypothetical protein ACPG4U_09265, partial [Pseudomonadales bacterium]